MSSEIKESNTTSTVAKHDADNDSIDPSLHEGATWGPWLLRITLAGTLLFMWWLVIYDHGVIAHH